jgi:aspartyl/glutamyl-tRNA(Asn/Gln) amidotransferase C subunit
MASTGVDSRGTQRHIGDSLCAMGDAPLPPSLPLTAVDVRRVARLARLDLDDAAAERFRAQLASILEYVRLLEELDVRDVEPLFHVSVHAAVAHRLDHDDPQPPLPLEAMTRNAPAMEGRLLAVPKVISDGAEGG